MIVDAVGAVASFAVLWRQRAPGRVLQVAEDNAEAAVFRRALRGMEEVEAVDVVDVVSSSSSSSIFFAFTNNLTGGGCGGCGG